MTTQRYPEKSLIYNENKQGVTILFFGTEEDYMYKNIVFFSSIAKECFSTRTRSIQLFGCKVAHRPPLTTSLYFFHVADELGPAGAQEVLAVEKGKIKCTGLIT